MGKRNSEGFFFFVFSLFPPSRTLPSPLSRLIVNQKGKNERTAAAMMVAVAVAAAESYVTSAASVHHHSLCSFFLPLLQRFFFFFLFFLHVIFCHTPLARPRPRVASSVRGHMTRQSSTCNYHPPLPSLPFSPVPHSLSRSLCSSLFPLLAQSFTSM